MGLSLDIARTRQRARTAPLDTFEFNSTIQRDAARYIAAGVETYVRAAVKWGKTSIGCVMGDSFALGRRSIGIGEWGTVELPILPLPNVGVVLIPSYKQGSEASVMHYRRYLGTATKKETKIAGTTSQVGLLSVATPLCRHRDGVDCQHCSRIYFVSGEGEIPKGFQVDWIHADEIPSEEHWRELRMRSRANSTFYAWVTATPDRRSEYAWLQKDFAGCIGAAKDGKVELVAQLETNRFLSPRYIAAQKVRARTDPFYRARIYGEYVDVTNACPFDYAGLQKQLARCRPGRRAAAQMVVRDGEEVWRLTEHPRGILEVWDDPVPGEQYILIADPSMGVRDPDLTDAEQKRNPAGMNMISVHGRKQVVRFNGYVSAAELGKLARVCCETYNNAMFVPEMNGGYGETMLVGFGTDYSNVYSYISASDRGAHQSRKVGWYQTHSRRGILIGSLQRAIDEDGLEIRSAAAIQSLMNVRFGVDERPDEGRGMGPHAEDMITIGVGAYLLETLPAVAFGEAPPDETPVEAWIREHGGRRAKESEEGYGGRMKS